MSMKIIGYHTHATRFQSRSLKNNIVSNSVFVTDSKFVAIIRALIGRVVELVDTQHSKCCAFGRDGSTPSSATNQLTEALLTVKLIIKTSSRYEIMALLPWRMAYFV